MVSGTFLLLVALAAFAWYLLTRPHLKNLPPGPKGLPIVGNLFQMDKLTSVTYTKWAKKYGPIFQIKLLNKRTIVISDHKLIKEAFSETALSGRQDFSTFDVAGEGSAHGLFNTEGERWEQLRRFTLKQLRDFGFGKISMEESIMTEVNELIENLSSQDAKSSSEIKQNLLLAVINSLWFIVTGNRYKHTDPFLTALNKETHDTFGEVLKSPSAMLLLFVPAIAKLLPSSVTGMKKMRKTIDNAAEFFRVPIEEHKATYSADFQRDFIDCFLREIYSAKDPKSEFYGKLGENNLLATIFNLYFAGTDSTSSTLSWLILYLSKMPQIQRRFQQEIDDVTGKSRKCSLTDKPNMPYTEALIAETHRFASISGDGVSHRAVRDVVFKGYLIPKDSLITPNFRFVHHNPEVWGDPENFRPERFLSSDGKRFVKHEALMPFSVGRRQCIGEALARDSLFLFATNLFQRFSFDFDKNGPDHGYEPEVNFILCPKPFNVLISDRIA